MNELENQASILRNEALEIIQKTDLLDYLKAFGEVEIVGSVQLNLMTWRDIDIHVYLGKLPQKEHVSNIAKYLFNKEGIRKVTCIDYLNYRISENISNKPEGQYMGAEYIDSENNKWKIDIWLFETKRNDSTSELATKITADNRKLILEIKNHFHSHPQYRSDFTSIDIYSQVFDSKITSIDEFKTFLKQKGIE